jgi:hypothetical protein
MNVDVILAAFNRNQVDYLLIGGMNFLMRHAGPLTYDVDVWIDDTPENRRRTESALSDLRAEWGRADEDWGAVSNKPAGWLDQQSLYCLTSPAGSIDVFRSVAGLSDWHECRSRATRETSSGGIEYLGLCDEDMLRCQYALPSGERKPTRIAVLEDCLQPPGPGDPS